MGRKQYIIKLRNKVQQVNVNSLLYAFWSIILLKVCYSIYCSHLIPRNSRMESYVSSRHKVIPFNGHKPNLLMQRSVYLVDWKPELLHCEVVTTITFVSARIFSGWSTMYDNRGKSHCLDYYYPHCKTDLVSMHCMQNINKIRFKQAFFWKTLFFK